MQTNQIYGLLNAVASEGLGGAGCPAVIDSSTLIAYGNAILSSQTNTEAFLNTLVQRIGKTIFSFRKYTSKEAQDLTRDNFEMGAILQKIKVRMTKAKFDPSYDLSPNAYDDYGNPVNRDPFTVDAPEIRQSLFVKRTPDMYSITVPVDLLNEAFLSDTAAGSFISMVYGEVRNAIEYGLNILAKRVKVAAVENCAKHQKGLRYINLLGEAVSYGIIDDPFADAGGRNIWTDAIINGILKDADFLKYAIQRINGIIDMMGELTTNFSAGGDAHFTPEDQLKVLLSSDFVRSCETHVQAGAFNDDKVSLKASFRAVPFWQTSRYGEAEENSELYQLWGGPLANLTAEQIPHKYITACMTFFPWEKYTNASGTSLGVYHTTDIISNVPTSLTLNGNMYFDQTETQRRLFVDEAAAVLPVLGMAFDRASMGIVEKPERDYSILNPKDQTWHNYYHVNNMYYFDENENMVVFTLGDPTMYIKASQSTDPDNVYLVQKTSPELFIL